ncbi:MAG: flagellar hook-length control protein FliK [Lachnospiraceae bacterium]|nr:flagellar hook-length control protein FliK [Lachnospiraceae bacterium]
MAMSMAVDLGQGMPQMPTPKNNVQMSKDSGSDFQKIMGEARSKQGMESKMDFADRKNTGMEKKPVDASNKGQEDQAASAKNTNTVEKNAESKPIENKEPEERLEEPAQEETVPEEELEKAGEEVYAALFAMLSEYGIEEPQLQEAMEEMNVAPQDLLNQNVMAGVIGELLPKMESLPQDANPMGMAEEILQALPAETIPQGMSFAGQQDLFGQEFQSMDEQPAFSEMPFFQEEAEGSDVSFEERPFQQAFSEGEEAEGLPAENREVFSEDPFNSREPQERPVENQVEQSVSERQSVPEGQSVESQRVSRQDGEAHHMAGLAERAPEPIMEAPEIVPDNMAQSTDIQEIVDQVNGYIRTQIRPGVSEVEMQLHPASLGTINIQLQAREGGITAQFTAQNESVRAALEGQVAQLKEQLESAGVKIEAVEVTVESHAFEQNLQQGRDQNQQYQEGEPARRRGIRRLTPLQLESLFADGEEELSDEDRLNAEMMRQNGGTLDYLA